MVTVNLKWWTGFFFILCLNSITLGTQTGAHHRHQLRKLCDQSFSITCGEGRRIKIDRLSSKQLVCADNDSNCGGDLTLSAPKVKEACDGLQKCYSRNITEMLGDPSVCSRNPGIKISIHYRCPWTETTTVPEETTISEATTPEVTTTTTSLASTSTRRGGNIQEPNTYSNCNASLKRVPKDIPPNVIKIDLSGNQITTLSTESFPQDSKWETLNLTNNRITIIRRAAFVNLNQLKDLYLNGNKISEIESGAFGNLDQLKTLTLNGNPLQEIRGDMWQGLRGLVVLRIRTANTRLSPKAFSNLQSLQNLSLNLEHLKTYSSCYLNSSNFPDTPKEQATFEIDIGGMKVSCDNSFCFLNNMQKKGLIGGFTKNGKPIPDPVCDIDQNPFWNYSSLNCESLDDDDLWGTMSEDTIFFIVTISVTFLLFLLLCVVVWYACRKRNRLNIKSEPRTEPYAKDEIYMRELSPEEEEYFKELDIDRYNLYLSLKNQNKQTDEGYVEFEEPPKAVSV